MSQKKKDKDALTELELNFISIWFNNGFNGTQAYRMAKPDCTEDTARVAAARLLAKDNIKREIELRKLAIRNRESIELGFIVQELKSIIYELKPQAAIEYNADGTQVINRKDYKSLISSLALLTKIAGFDNHIQKVEVEGIDETPKEITVNINKSKK